MHKVNRTNNLIMPLIVHRSEIEALSLIGESLDAFNKRGIQTFALAGYDRTSRSTFCYQA